jgi:4-amino-4-deoxy-L-arabinose transferase-like glycosyltransferase
LGMEEGKRVERPSALDWLGQWRRPLLFVVVLFAALRFVHLKADFPLHSQFAWEDAPMVDEGWYSSSATNAWLGRGWILPGDFNPGVAMPVWPAMVWVGFHVGGFGIVTLRVMSVLVFLVVVGLTYRVAVVYDKERIGLFAVFFLMTSPYCFGFSRLAFLEFPMIMFLLAAALAIGRRDRQNWTRYVLAGILIGLSLLTKTLAVFLFPGMLYLIVERSGFQLKSTVKNLASVVAGTVAVLLPYYVLYVVHHREAFDYFFAANTNRVGPTGALQLFIRYSRPFFVRYSRPFRKGLSTDNLFFVTAVLSAMGAVVLPGLRGLWRRPLFVFSQLWIFGTLLMMGLHNNAVPRYYEATLPGLFLIGAMLLEALEEHWPRVGRVFVALVLIEAVVNTAETLYFVARPTSTLLEAAEGVKALVESDPGVIISHNAFELTLFTGLPGINEDYGEEPIRQRVAHYRARWWVRQGYWDDGSLMNNGVGDQYRFVEAGQFQVFNHRPGYIVYRMVPAKDATVNVVDER